MMGFAGKCLYILAARAGDVPSTVNACLGEAQLGHFSLHLVVKGCLDDASGPHHANSPLLCPERLRIGHYVGRIEEPVTAPILHLNGSSPEEGKLDDVGPEIVQTARV